MKRRVALLLSCILAAAGCLLAGCPGTATTTSYTPITGILIRASSLVAGHGCGTGLGQVYKYAAILTYIDEAGIPDNHAPHYSGVFDCYADGLFSNLPVDPADNSLSFDVKILAWDQAAFPASLACDAGDAAFAGCPGDAPDAVLANEGTPTWQTDCTATQQSGVSVLAVCPPLSTPNAGSDAGADASDGDASMTGGAPIVVDTHGFVSNDGGTFRCGTDFQTVRATYTSGSQSGSASTDCPASLSVTPTIAGDAYTITVELFPSEAGTPVAQVSCQGTASAATPTIATCAPATGP